MTKRAKRIYLAGPEVFLPPDAFKRVAAAKKDVCERHGFFGVLPVDPDKLQGARQRSGCEISESNQRLMRGCDLVIANMTPFRGPSMDVGTAYEMGFMRSLDRPVLGYSNVKDTLLERMEAQHGGTRSKAGWVDANQMAIEDFGLGDNLMVDCAVTASNATVERHAADPERIFEDLTAFEKCVAQAANMVIPSARTFYHARPWGWARIESARSSFWITTKNDPRRAINIAGKHLEGLYLLRVPLLTLLLLIALPTLMLYQWRPLLGNLFTDLGWPSIFVTTLITFLTAATAVAVVNAILVNGHERFPSLPMGRYYGGPFHWLAIVAPVPMIATIVGLSQERLWASAAAVAGALALGTTIFLWIRIQQAERGARIQKHLFDDWSSRPLVYPYPLPFDLDSTRPELAEGVIDTGKHWYLWPLVVPWFAAQAAHGVTSGIGKLKDRFLRTFQKPGDSQASYTPRNAGIADRLLRWVVPEAGFVYALDDAGQRSLYSTPHFLLLLTIILFIVWLALSIGKPYSNWFRLPALVYLLLTAWLGCLVVSTATFVLDRYRIPLLTVLLVWAFLVSPLFPNDHYYETTRSAAVAPEPLLPQSLLERRRTQPIVVVAAAGGGIQAASWTARVLTELAAELPERFSTSVALLSGVSGGFVGVYYFADAYGGSSAGTTTRFTDAFNKASASSLEDIAWGLTAIDLPQRFAPWKLPLSFALKDRGWALEQTFDQRSTTAGATLAGWEKDAIAGTRPAVLFNATLVETGVPLLFGTTRIPDDVKPGFPHDWVDFRALNGKGDLSSTSPDVKVATAVRLSATFPFVSPVAASSLNDNIELSRHVADGGYYDNFGMMSLMAWVNRGLRGLEVRNAGATPLPRILVLQIRSFPESLARCPEPRRSWLFQIYAPLTTLTAVRGTAQDLRNRQTFDLLQSYWKSRGANIETLPVNFVSGDPKPDGPPRDPCDSGSQGREETPLSWRLSQAQLRAIDDSWKSQKEETVAQVRRFLEGN